MADPAFAPRYTPFAALDLGLPDDGRNDILESQPGSGGLYGGGGDDILIGDSSGNALYGGTGNDVMIGGDGADLFHIDINDGKEILADFDPTEDEIYLWSEPKDFAGHQSIADTARASPSGYAVVDIGKTVVTLVGIAPEEVSADWFTTINY